MLRVRGDGRCLFRSVAQGEALRADPPRRLRAPEEEARADALRAACVAELESRRAEVEGFIAGSFERYLLKMSRSFTWGGEPELFALSHVLERQIWVRLSGGAGGEPGGGGAGGRQSSASTGRARGATRRGRSTSSIPAACTTTCSSLPSRGGWNSREAGPRGPGSATLIRVFIFFSFLAERRDTQTHQVNDPFRNPQECTIHRRMARPRPAAGGRGAAPTQYSLEGHAGTAGLLHPAGGVCLRGFL